MACSGLSLFIGKFYVCFFEAGAAVPVIFVAAGEGGSLL